MKRLLVACAAAVALTVQAQEFPAKPIRIVVPFAPGGVADNSARVVAEPLGQRLGQQVVVENRPGASGNIGTQQVAQSAPDGYTLLLGFDGTMVINPHVFPKTRFDTLKDFAPVTKLGDATLILVAHPSLPAKTLRRSSQLSKSKAFALRHLGHRRHAPPRGRAPQAAHRRPARARPVQRRRARGHRRSRRARSRSSSPPSPARSSTSHQPAGRARRAGRETLERAAGCADLPGKRPRRLRRFLLDRHLRARRHAARGGGAPAEGARFRSAVAPSSRSATRSWVSSRWATRRRSSAPRCATTSRAGKRWSGPRTCGWSSYDFAVAMSLMPSSPIAPPAARSTHTFQRR